MQKKRKPHLIDLWLVDLEYHIGRGDLKTISNILQEAKIPIPPEVLHKLGTLLDPAGPKKKRGPKPKAHLSFYGSYDVGSMYYELRNNRDLALTCLGMADDIQRGRNPEREEIKDLVCKMYCIGSRKFDDMLALYNRVEEQRKNIN